MDWQLFFNEDNSLFVNARHRTLHADAVARGMAEFLPPGAPVVLDWGCGEAESVPVVADRCARLYLFDGAPRVRGHLHQRYGADPRITVLEEDALRELPEASLDCIFIVSVAQYLSNGVFAATLDHLRTKLAMDGRLVLGDIIPRGRSPYRDAGALLVFAARNGFLFTAAAGLVRTFFSDYRALREDLGFTQWGEAELIDFLADHGFAARRAATNIGHNQGRRTFIAVRIR